MEPYLLYGAILLKYLPIETIYQETSGKSENCFGSLTKKKEILQLFYRKTEVSCVFNDLRTGYLINISVQNKRIFRLSIILQN